MQGSVGNDLGQAMGGMMEVMGKVLGAVMQASQAAGLSEAEMATLKAKAKAGTPLDVAERVKVQRFAELLAPALETISAELGAAAAPMIGQIQGQFTKLLEQP